MSISQRFFHQPADQGASKKMKSWHEEEVKSDSRVRVRVRVDQRALTLLEVSTVY